MTKDIAKHIDFCECQLNKKGIGNAVPPLKPIYITSPFAKMGIDILGPLPPSLGKEYIIVATDYFTRWVEMKALAKKNALSTAKFLVENIFSRPTALRQSLVIKAVISLLILLKKSLRLLIPNGNCQPLIVLRITG